MSEHLTVSIRDLRAALERLLAHIEETQGRDVDLAADHYWVVSARGAFELGAEPTPTVGQLSDDLESLAEQVASSEAPVVWHDAEHLIGVLRRLAALDSPQRA